MEGYLDYILVQCLFRADIAAYVYMVIKSCLIISYSPQISQPFGRSVICLLFITKISTRRAPSGGKEPNG